MATAQILPPLLATVTIVVATAAAATVVIVVAALVVLPSLLLLPLLIPSLLHMWYFDTYFRVPYAHSCLIMDQSCLFKLNVSVRLH